MAANTPKKSRSGVETAKKVTLTTLRVIGSTLKWLFASIGTFLMICLVTGVMFACIFVVYCQNYLVEDTEPVNLDDFQLDETSFIYYYDKDSQDWEVLQELYFEKRTWVSYEELPSYVFDALVAIEDHRYYSHNGVDWRRTLGAAYTIFLGDGSTFGGSTITQQVIKNITGNNEVTVRRKLQEIFQAIDVDRRYSKEDVLEVYMNLVYFGQGCYGIQAAAQTYFGKDASDLTLPEAAAIVGITNLPTYYDPYQNRDNNKERQVDILYRMYELGYIETEEEYHEAKDTKLVFKRDVANSSTTIQRSEIQSYFVDQVIEDVIADLMVEKGVSYRIAEQYLFTGGYKIYTTLDTDVQAVIDEVYTNPEYWPELRDADSLEQPPQSAIVVLDPYTGNVLGMYGGLGEKTTNRAKNRAVQMTKQPGSSIKPVAIYAPALESGLVDPYDVYTDLPAMVESDNAYPKNYDRVYRGQITIMEAVQRSNNTIPVQLVNTMGPEYCFEFAKYKMGLSTLVEGEYRGEQYFTDAAIAAMSLGGLTDGVTVLDMAAAYAVFPNAGVYIEPRTYLRVLDSNDQVFIENEPNSSAVIKESTAFYMNNLLTNVITNGTGVNARLTNSVAAGKTGTTDDDYDRWFVGYTPYYSCSVWYGFDYNHTINTVSGTSPAVPLWQAVMEKLHENLEPQEFFTPTTSDVVRVSYCRDSGHLASEACRADLRGSRVLTGTFLSEDMPSEVCSMHQYVDVCGESKQLVGEFCPEEGVVKASMLNIARYFELPNIQLLDEQYTLRDPAVDYTLPTDVGYRVMPNVPNGANTVCALHTAPEEPVDPNDDPNAGEFPTEPVDPTVSGEPSAPPSGEPTTAEPSVPPTVEPSEPPIEDYPEEVSPSPEFPTEPDDEPIPSPSPSTEASFEPATA